MIVRIEMIRPTDKLKEQLQRGGWRIVDDQSKCLSLRHHRVTSEAEARLLLQHLGLLTSPLVRIRFQKIRPGLQALAN